MASAPGCASGIFCQRRRHDLMKTHQPRIHSRGVSSRSSMIGKLGVTAAVCFVMMLMIVSAAPRAFAQDEAKRLVSLLDYLGSDYKNAVKDGKILSQDEYGEMQEFSKRSQELLNQLKAADKSDKAGVEPTIKALAAQIDKKAEPKIIADLA